MTTKKLSEDFEKLNTNIENLFNSLWQELNRSIDVSEEEIYVDYVHPTRGTMEMGDLKTILREGIVVFDRDAFVDILIPVKDLSLEDRLTVLYVIENEIEKL